MNAALLVPVVVASLLGSVHCAAMCGSFVAAVGGREARRSAPAHVAYNAGRLVAYVTLGAVAGTVGRAVDLAGSAAEIGQLGALASGALMILWGASAMLATQGVRWFRVRAPAFLVTRGAAWVAGLRGLPPSARGLALGLSSALLPCGWLYAFVVSAAATGNAWEGAAVLLAFWSGTVPMLLGVGVALERVLSRLKAHVPILSASVILALGLFTVVSRVQVPAFALHATAVTTDGAPGAAAAPCPLHARSAR